MAAVRKRGVIVMIALSATLLVLFWCSIRQPPRLDGWSHGSRHEAGKLRSVMPASHANQTSHGQHPAWSPPVEDALSGRLPDWFRNFTAWQNEQLGQLREDNWRSFRFLVLRCLERDPTCDGASDRLHSVPLSVLYAARTDRIFFIRWTKPARLEEFLVPPPLSGRTTPVAGRGLNWSVPDWLTPELDRSSKKPLYIWNNLDDDLDEHPEKALAFMDMLLVPQINRKTVLSFSTRSNPKRARPFYDAIVTKEKEHRGEAEKIHGESFEDSFPAIWHHLFRPSVPVADLLHREQERLGLPEKGRPYVSAHARTRYRGDTVGLADELVRQSIHCAADSRRDANTDAEDATTTSTVIYFASDDPAASRRAVEYGQSLGVRVVTRQSETASGEGGGREEEVVLHLDRGPAFLGREFLRNKTAWKLYSAADYYGVFVDFFLLAGAKCVSYGLGNYGSLAALLSANRSCACPYWERYESGSPCPLPP